MATVVITADTETGEIEVDIDGEEYSDVNYASVMTYKNYDDEEGVSVTISLEPEKVSHLTKRVNISTANTNEAKQAIADQTAEFITKDKSIIKFNSMDNLSDAIAKMLGRNKKNQ
jgi:hypothetical protein